MKRLVHDKPLVSIIVIAYNSSKYILETLESAKKQTYQNVELIITDDASQDDTIDICKNWLTENQERFVRTELITIKNNTGIAPNCNRGLKKSRGHWVKFIAGDDLLLMNCISTNISFAMKNECSFILSKVKLSEEKEVRLRNVFDRGYRLVQGKDQITELLNGNFIPAAGIFLKRKTLIELNGFDEEYNMLEDYPLWVKAIINGHRIFYIDTFTTIYRIHSESVSQNKLMKSHFYNHLEISENKFKIKIVLIQLKFGRIKKIISLLIDFLIFKIIMISGNRNSKFLSKLYNLGQFVRKRKSYR